jgi:hypothetical protein
MDGMSEIHAPCTSIELEVPKVDILTTITQGTVTKPKIRRWPSAPAYNYVLSLGPNDGTMTIVYSLPTRPGHHPREPL